MAILETICVAICRCQGACGKLAEATADHRESED